MRPALEPERAADTLPPAPVPFKSAVPLEERVLSVFMLLKKKVRTDGGPERRAHFKARGMVWKPLKTSLKNFTNC
jgi:hypothetical protein